MENKVLTGSTQSILPKQYSYQEIVDYLDARWNIPQDKNLSCVTQLDKEFGNISKQVDTILITGTNGKSLTTNYSAQLLQEEGLTVGSFISPHILTYNERFVINGEQIQNKQFTEIGNEVIAAAERLNLKASALDLLFIIAMLYFKKQNVHVALIEVSPFRYHPATICHPKVTGITRITEAEISGLASSMEQAIKDSIAIAKKGGHIVSADQSKINLQIMQTFAEQQESVWMMPVRKLATLPYPFEQLHGRCAALAERVAQIYMNEHAPVEFQETESLFIRQKGQRGRPTLEAKRKSELNPRKTVEQFWKENEVSLPGRFQLLVREKPTILLDTASNLDAFNNLFLGIRLLHYQRPLKGLTLILSLNNKHLDTAEMLKLIRYFFKKTTGQLFICPAEPLPGSHDAPAHNIEQMIHELKTMKIKARGVNSFKEAFEAAEKTVDERQGLLVIAGSTSIINEFWRLKGIKKL